MDEPDAFPKVFGTPWLKDLDRTRLAAKGIRVISWYNYFGTRPISCRKKPIHKPRILRA